LQFKINVVVFFLLQPFIINVIFHLNELLHSILVISV